VDVGVNGYPGGARVWRRAEAFARADGLRQEQVLPVVRERLQPHGGLLHAHDGHARAHPDVLQGRRTLHLRRHRGEGGRERMGPLPLSRQRSSFMGRGPPALSAASVSRAVSKRCERLTFARECKARRCILVWVGCLGLTRRVRGAEGWRGAAGRRGATTRGWADGVSIVPWAGCVRGQGGVLMAPLRPARGQGARPVHLRLAQVPSYLRPLPASTRPVLTVRAIACLCPRHGGCSRASARLRARPAVPARPPACAPACARQGAAWR
jgi:hypothetical protein